MFINRVHEQCSKNLTQENTESKRIKNGPSAQPPASPHAQPRPAVPRAPRTSAARLQAQRQRVRLRTQHAQPRAQLPSPLSQYNFFFFLLRYSLASCSLLQYNTLYCNTTLQQPFQSIAIQSSLYLCNTNHCIATQNPYTSLLTCNTILYCNQTCTIPAI